jgi:hypothetical protein
MKRFVNGFEDLVTIVVWMVKESVLWVKDFVVDVIEEIRK